MPLSAQQICDLARQRAKCRGFETQSGEYLNVILAELCQNYDFTASQGSFNFNLTPASVPIGNLNAQLASGPFQLPADYLRAKEGDIYYYPIGLGNYPLPLIPIDINEFDGLVQTAGFANFPVYFVTDMSQNPHVAYVWPPASGAYPAFLRYYRQMPDIVTPETSAVEPWFPNQQYLIEELAGRLMQLTDDARAEATLGDINGNTGSRAILRRYLKMQGDKTDRSQSVKLDRRRFGKQYSALPRSKYLGGW